MNLTQQVKTPDARLRELLDTYGLKQADICKRCNFKKSSMSCYVNGKKAMGSHVLETISTAYDVSIDWLMGFDVPMKKRDRLIEEKVNAFMSKYSNLSMEDRIIIDSLIDRMLEKKDAQDNETR